MNIGDKIWMSSLLTALWSMPAFAEDDPLRTSWQRCEAGPMFNLTVIDGCTAIISSGKETGKDLAAAYSIRAGAMAQKGDLRSAVADYSEALKIDPEFVVLLRYNRGVAFAQLGDWANAIADFDEAIRHNPSFANAYVERGIAHAKAGQSELALADFTKVIEIEPSNADNYQNRAILLRDMGRTAEADADMAKAKALAK